MFQDIRQSRRSLKEVLPGRQSASSRPKKVTTEEPEELKVSTYPQFSSPPRSRLASLFIFLLIVVFAVVGIIAISSLFSGAKVVIIPKSTDLAFDKTVINYSPAESMIFLPISESVALVATGEEKVSEKAAGQIVVYNDYSTASQKLIATTRFESKAGKIYRLVEAVTVPGQKTINGKLVPGSVEVKVVADEAGESFNTSLTDFTIPGFKGGARYDKFYARSKTPITGGLIGTRPVVAKADQDQAIKTLHASLVPKMLAQSRAQIPEGFILYDSAATFEFTDKLVSESGASSNATMVSTIDGTAFLLDEARLTTGLLESQPNDLSELSVVMPEIRLLDVQVDDTSKDETGKDKTLELTVSGTTTAVAQLDSDKLISLLADQPKSLAGTIFNQFAEIQSAKVSLTPPWLRRFPQDQSKIKVELLTP